MGTNPERYFRSFSNQHIDDDGSTEERGYGIERDNSTIRRQRAEQIAEQGKHGTHEHRGWQQAAVVLRADDKTSDVGSGKTDEGNGAAEGCYHRREQPRNDQQGDAQPADAKSQILGILFAQEQGIERLDEQKRSQQSEDGNGNEPSHLSHREVLPCAKEYTIAVLSTYT